MIIPAPDHARSAPARMRALGQSTGLGALLSVLLHMGLAMAALVLAQPRQDQAERGGLPAAMDISLIGEVEQAASEAGARADAPLPVVPKPAEPAVTTAALVPDAERLPAPEFPPAAEIQPVPETSPAMLDLPPVAPPLAPAFPAPEPVPAPVPSPQALPEKAVSPPAARPALPRRQTEAPKLQTRAKSLVRPAAQPLARGQGEAGNGQQAANRHATSRGGSGGNGATAGHANTAGYGARLRALIERQKSYPEQAQERGLTGRATIALVVTRDGRLASVSIARGSGHALLDSATLAAVRRAQPFPPLPEGAAQTASFTLTIGYALD